MQRLGGAWQEVCDQARDIGILIPTDATRREVARMIPAELWEARPLADRIDDAMFGFVEPDEKTVESVWSEAERDREAMLASLPTRPRLRARLSLMSLRPKRAAKRVQAAARAAAAAASRAAAEADAAAADEVANAGSRPVSAADPRALATTSGER